MKRNMLFSVLFLISNISFCQGNKNEILSILSFDSTLIKERGILSAQVYSDYYYSDDLMYTFKRMEIEFDTNGMRTFQRFILLNDDFINLGNYGTTYASFTYDDQLRVLTSCHSQKFHSFCLHYTYDRDNFITSIVNDGDAIQNSKIQFTWKDGKMIKALCTNIEETEVFDNRTFNDKGWIKSVKFENGRRFEFEYIENDKGHRTYIQSFDKDSLTSLKQFDIIKSTNQFTYYCEQNGNLDTLEVLIAKYDESHNLIYLQMIDYRNIYNFSRDADIPPVRDENNGQKEDVFAELAKPIVQTIYIENFYDKGLLVKRSIFELSKKNPAEKYLMGIERIVYERDTLPVKNWPATQNDEYDGDFYEESPYEVEPVPVEKK